jgi:carboxyl-terminal processing protease
MMNSLDRSLKTILIVLLVVAGAAFFYMAGLGTGMYAANAGHTGVPDNEATVALAETAEPAQPGPMAGSTSTPLPGPTTDNAPVSFDIFWEAWGILQEEFYGDLPPESELPYEAIRGVIAATGDQYTAFLDPARAAILKTDLEGSFEGIGATVRMRLDGKIEIVQPLAGWPAIKAGLRAKDTILQVDDVSTAGMTLYEAIALIRGPAGTVVRLLVEREGVDQPFEIPIERARIEMPVVESKMLEQDIGYVRLTEFGQTATTKIEQALRELNAQDPKGLILDLRGNRGGYLITSVEITSQFVGQGTIVIERFKDGQERSYAALPGGLATEIPLVVLVDGGSASASEITAGAIQDTERGVLIGTTTLGKGSVQIAHTLSDNSELRITVARWFTPNGRAIHGEGLVPDISVEITEEDLLAERDPQLDRAIRYLEEGK